MSKVSHDIQELKDVVEWAISKGYPTIVHSLLEQYGTVSDVLDDSRLRDRLQFFSFAQKTKEFQYTNADSFVNAIKIFDLIHKSKADNLLSLGIKPIRWWPLRKRLLLHVGFSILLKHLKVTEDDVREALETQELNLSRNSLFRIFDFEDELKETYMKLSYTSDDLDDNLIKDFEDQFTATGSSILLDITDGHPKKPHLAPNKIILLFGELDIEKTSADLLTYINDLERKICGSITLKVVSNTDRMSIRSMHEPDWSDDVARSSGPYGKGKEASASKLNLNSASRNVAASVLKKEVSKPSTPVKSTEISKFDEIAERFGSSNSTKKITETLMGARKAFDANNAANDPLNFIDQEDIAPIKHVEPSKKRALETSPVNKELSPAKKSLIGPRPSAETIAFDDIEEFDDKKPGTAIKALMELNQNLPAKSDFPATLTEKEVIEEDGVEPRAKELSRRRSSSLQRRREKRGSEGRRFMWTFDEEQALLDGIKAHGLGNWSLILEDAEFKDILKHRTNVNLKDKYRNMKKKGLVLDEDD